MPVQFPTFSNEEQTERVEDYAENTLYPYSYYFFTDFTQANFPFLNSTLLAGVRFFTIGFQADNNLAISALQVNLAVNIVTAAALFFTSIVEVSYASVLDSGFITVGTGTPVVPTVPSDKGNIIYRNSLSVNSFVAGSTATPGIIDDFRRFKPNDCLVKFNQIVYIHIGLEATAFLSVIAANGTMSGSIIFHTIDTGAKT